MSGWTSPTPDVEVEARRGVTVLRLARPQKLNALTAEMLQALAEALRDHADGTRTAGIVMTGSGRAFCAGEDLDALQAEGDAEGFRLHLELFHEVSRAILDTEVPVLAAVNGIAVGGAAEMILSCDARIASPRGEVMFPERRLGLVISNGSSYLLPRMLGLRATAAVMDGARWSASEALDAGLFDEVVEADVDPVEACVDRVLEWTTPPTSIASMLPLMRPPRLEVEAAMARETEAGLVEFARGASLEGTRRFLARSGTG